MGVAVIVLGRSGSGKSASLRNFEPGEVGILNVMSKPLPFRKKLESFDTCDYETITDCIKSGKRRAWVVDDAGYLMQLQNFAMAKKKGYEKFVDIAYNFEQLMVAATTAPEDTITYLMMHPEVDADGNEKIKTAGKMIDEKFGIEGAVPILIECEVVDGKHVFVTENNGSNLAKAPVDIASGERMLPPVMDNDLKAVDTAIRGFWGMKPLKDSPGKAANAVSE